MPEKRINKGLSPRTATCLGFFALVFWSTTSAGCRAAVEMFGPCTFVGITSGIAGVLIILASAWQTGSILAPFRLSKASLIICGPLFLAYFGLYATSFSLAPRREMVLSLGLLNYLWPPLTMLFSVPLLRRRARWALILPGIAIAIFGTALSMLRWGKLSSFLRDLQDAPLSFALMLFAAICWGLYSNLTRKYPEPKILGAVGFFQLVTGLTMAVLRFVLKETSHFDSSAIGLLIYMTVFPTMAGYLFWDIGLRKGNTLKLNVTSYLLPITSTVAACLLLKVTLTAPVMIGSVCVVIGALLSKHGISHSIEY